MKRLKMFAKIQPLLTGSFFVKAYSLMIILYFSIARLGETGDYMKAGGTGLLLLAVWLLGYNASQKEKK